MIVAYPCKMKDNGVVTVFDKVDKVIEERVVVVMVVVVVVAIDNIVRTNN